MPATTPLFVALFIGCYPAAGSNRTAGVSAVATWSHPAAVLGAICAVYGLS